MKYSGNALSSGHFARLGVSQTQKAEQSGDSLSARSWALHSVCAHLHFFHHFCLLMCTMYLFYGAYPPSTIYDGCAEYETDESPPDDVAKMRNASSPSLPCGGYRPHSVIPKNRKNPQCLSPLFLRADSLPIVCRHQGCLVAFFNTWFMSFWHYEMVWY